MYLQQKQPNTIKRKLPPEFVHQWSYHERSEKPTQWVHGHSHGPQESQEIV